MTEQQRAALEEMTRWLMDERELGCELYAIENAGDFILDELRYYIFKFQREEGAPWLLGVCGGYYGEETEHCGHVFSDMALYYPETARGDAAALVDEIRTYWMERAQEEMERRGLPPLDEDEEAEEASAGGQGGTFVGFVLLESCEWSPGQIRDALWEDWGLSVSGAQEGSDGESVVWEIDGRMAAVSLMPAPVPDGEAERCAQTNLLWPDAVRVAQNHQAHLLVAVLGGQNASKRDASCREAGELYVKLCCACLKQQNSVGVYTAGTVLQPEFYLEAAGLLREGDFPVFNLVFVGGYRGETGTCGYTNGLKAFGKPELEVLESARSLTEIRDFLYAVSAYVLTEDVLLQDGETIGFSEDEKLPITLSEGAAVEGNSLKIGF